MSDISKLFAGAQNKSMREAMRQLGSMYGVKDQNTFVQMLLQNSEAVDHQVYFGDQANKTSSQPDMSTTDMENSSTSSPLSLLSDAIISLQGDGVYSHQLQEVIEKYITDAPKDKLAQTLKGIPNQKEESTSPPFSLTLPNNPNKETKGYLRGIGVDSLLHKEGSAFKNRLTDDDRRRAISIIEMHHPNLNFANRDSMASVIFLSSLPSIEMSRAIPYLDVKTVVKNSPFKDPDMGGTAEPGKASQFGNGISIYKFLHGERVEAADSTLIKLASSVPVEFTKQPPSLNGKAGDRNQGKPEDLQGQATVAGMEIFTSPQTMVNADAIHKDLDATPGPKDPIPYEEKVLDKFRPLMTIKSMDVQVTPATGMLATKSATLTMTLHDKSQMHQITPFVTPGQLSDVEILCEWGWNHPDSDPAVNPYGALINSMKVKEKYGVMNSSYTFTPEGQVDISLKMFTKGAQNATFELVSNNAKTGEHPSVAIKKLVVAIRKAMRDLRKSGYKLNEEAGAPDILGKTKSVSGLLALTDGSDGTENQYKAIQDFIESMKKLSDDKGKWEALGKGFSDVQTETKSFKEKMKAQFKQMKNVCCSSQGHDDAYLIEQSLPKLGGSAHPKKAKKKVEGITKKTHVSFAKVITNFVAKPILDTGKFNEIQLVFYPLNEHAMFARNLNVGQYPINKSDLKNFIDKELVLNPSITINKFLNMLKRRYISYVGDDIYGLSNFYGEGEDGKREIAEAYTKDEKAKQKWTAIKAKLMKECYPNPNEEKKFKKPSVQMWVECVGHLDDPTQTILRLHFFDKQCTSYSSYASMWSATSSGEIGSVGKYVGLKRSLQKMEKPPTPKPKNWDDLKASRGARLTRFSKSFGDQIEKFKKLELLEPFQSKVIDNDDKDKHGTTVTKFRIKGGPDQLRGILAANMPTIKYGTEFSGVISASLQTNSDPQMETIMMQRQGASSGPANAPDDGLPLTIKPVSLSLETFGCPFINYGQQFFVDFQTNTTIDDIYAVSGVTHNISPGEFRTSITLNPLNKLGQFKSLTDALGDAVGMGDEMAQKLTE